MRQRDQNVKRGQQIGLNTETNPRLFNDIATEVNLIDAPMSEKLGIMKEFLRGANQFVIDHKAKLPPGTRVENVLFLNQDIEILPQ